jgi:hypothetical protein
VHRTSSKAGNDRAPPAEAPSGVMCWWLAWMAAGGKRALRFSHSRQLVVPDHPGRPLRRLHETLRDLFATLHRQATVRRTSRAVAPMINSSARRSGAEAADQRGRSVTAGYAVKRLSASLSPRDRRECGRAVPRGAHRARSALYTGREAVAATDRIRLARVEREGSAPRIGWEESCQPAWRPEPRPHGHRPHQVPRHLRSWRTSSATSSATACRSIAQEC